MTREEEIQYYTNAIDSWYYGVTNRETGHCISLDGRQRGLLGYVIAQTMKRFLSKEFSPNDYQSKYDALGNDVLSLFQEDPENAEAYENMLIALTGETLTGLHTLMGQEAFNYLALLENKQ